MVNYKNKLGRMYNNRKEETIYEDINSVICIFLSICLIGVILYYLKNVLFAQPKEHRGINRTQPMKQIEFNSLKGESRKDSIQNIAEVNKEEKTKEQGPHSSPIKDEDEDWNLVEKF